MSVSIGLPFFNAEAYLADAIRSVFAQTHQDWELLLIDDGSTDESLRIAHSVRDARVRVISDGVNRKLAARLNQVARLARFDFIARMDADDLMAPNRLELQLRELQSDPALDLVSTGLISLDARDEPVGVRVHISEGVSREQLLRRDGCGIVHASVLARRTWFERNPYDESVPIAQDYELWLRTSRNDDLRVRSLRLPLYYVRELASATPEKMFRSYRMDRQSIWKHRRSLAESRYIAKSFVKTFALYFINSTGNFERLIQQRSRPILDSDVVAEFRANLETIRAVKVPGF